MTATSVMHREEWPIAWQKAWREEGSRRTQDLIKAVQAYLAFEAETIAKDIADRELKREEYLNWM